MLDQIDLALVGLNAVAGSVLLQSGNHLILKTQPREFAAGLANQADFVALILQRLVEAFAAGAGGVFLFLALTVEFGRSRLRNAHLQAAAGIPINGSIGTNLRFGRSKTLGIGSCHGRLLIGGEACGLRLVLAIALTHIGSGFAVACDIVEAAILGVEHLAARFPCGLHGPRQLVNITRGGQNLVGKFLDFWISLRNRQDGSIELIHSVFAARISA